MKYLTLTLFAIMAISLYGANLIHEFTFDEDLEDSIGSSALQVIHANTGDFEDGAWNWTAQNNPGGGLLLPAYLPYQQCYTLQIHFKYNHFNPSWTKIISFNQIQQSPWGYFSNDSGLYFNAHDLAFYSVMYYTVGDFDVDTWYDLIISRSTENMVRVYIAELGQEPQLVMQFQDHYGIGIPSKLDSEPSSPSYFGLFYDDYANGSEWTTGGSVSLVKVWDDVQFFQAIDTINIEMIDHVAHLSWNPIQGATSYHVYCSDVPNPDSWVHLDVIEYPIYLHPTSDSKKFYRVTVELP